MEKIIRYTLGSLLMIVALNAFGGGYYGMAGAKDVPLELLEGSPFKDYFIPGLFLFVFVGGSSLISSVAVFKRHPAARRVSFLCGIIILVWIAVQVAIIGYVSWMQPATTIAGIIIMFLTYQLPQRNASI